MRESVVEAIRETSVSMFYTSVVLFFGFSIFLASEFGGTQALGALVSITLFLAMFSNLIILPSLLLTLDRFVGQKSIGRRFKPLQLEESDPEDS
jgi:predicted RND superfamily exporter protein